MLLFSLVGVWPPSPQAGVPTCSCWRSLSYWHLSQPPSPLGTCCPSLSQTVPPRLAPCLSFLQGTYCPSLLLTVPHPALAAVLPLFSSGANLLSCWRLTPLLCWRLVSLTSGVFRYVRCHLQVPAAVFSSSSIGYNIAQCIRNDE